MTTAADHIVPAVRAEALVTRDAMVGVAEVAAP